MNSITTIDKAIIAGKILDKAEVLRQLKWLQHERLIHLLVMLTTGIATLLITLGVVTTKSLPLGVLALILGILFGAYVLYYRHLELIVYRWYDYLSK